MRDFTDITAGHPLFKALRNGLFWHRTSPEEYRLIQIDGAIKPNDGRVNRWGGPYACQQLGGVSLFDFTTESEEKVIGEAVKWRHFMGHSSPMTVIIGLDPFRLPGRLVRYPDNKIGTTGNIIPYVEVCHCGPIPCSCIVSFLLVCAVDYSRFKKYETITEEILLQVSADFASSSKVDDDERARFSAKIHALNAQILAQRKNSPSQ